MIMRNEKNQSHPHVVVSVKDLYDKVSYFLRIYSKKYEAHIDGMRESFMRRIVYVNYLPTSFHEYLVCALTIISV